MSKQGNSRVSTSDPFLESMVRSNDLWGEVSTVSAPIETPWSRHFENAVLILVAPYQVKKIPASFEYITLLFITVFSRANHWFE
jgi:hypothetical protein